MPDHLAGEIRIGSANRAYDHALIPSDKPPVWRRIARIRMDIILVVTLPAFVMFAFGIWQMALPDQVVTADTPAQYKLEFKELTLHTADGYDISAWDVSPAKPSDDAILVLSGYAADKGSIVPRTAFLGLEHRLLYMDFRSFGKSSGWYSSMGLREVEDALAGVRYLKEQGVKRIGIYGYTMGGAVALMAAAREPAVTAVVTEDAYSDFGAVASQPYGYLGPAKPLFGRAAEAFAHLALRVDPEVASPAVAASSLRIPALIIHSPANASVPTFHADLLKERMKEDQDARFWYTDGKSDLESRTEFAQTLLAFFGEHLSENVRKEPAEQGDTTP